MIFSPKILIVGEAWGTHEEQRALFKGRPSPFVGKAGFFLYSRLFQAGIVKAPPPPQWPGALQMELLWKDSPHIALTNVFQLRPGKDSDDISLLFVPKTSPFSLKTLPPLSGLYLHEQYSSHLASLSKTIEDLRPNLILALGNTALWALLGTPGIKDARGNIAQTSPSSPKILPTYHPAAVLRRWSLLPVFQADLHKARIEMESPVLSRPDREIWTVPTIPDLWLWWDQHGQHSSLLSIDIETVRSSLISEFGVASSSTCALHIPFILENRRARTFSLFWETEEEEEEAWKFVRHVCSSPIPKIGQNFLYDFQYLLVKMHIPVHNVQHDTMLQHHALFPGMEKGLGFLSSIYCNEPQYKFLRSHSNKDDE